MKQTIYYNGTILTMRGEEIVEAILVEDGRIRDVGSNNEILNRKSPEAEVINLEGKTMLPAFIDPHSHFTSVASMLDKVDLSGCGSMEEIRDRLKAFRKEKGLARRCPCWWAQGMITTTCRVTSTPQRLIWPIRSCPTPLPLHMPPATWA